MCSVTNWSTNHKGYVYNGAAGSNVILIFPEADAVQTALANMNVISDYNILTVTRILHIMKQLKGRSYK